MPEKLGGAQLVARVAALEGFVRVLIHETLKRDPAAAPDIMRALAKASKEQVKTFPENKDMHVHNIIHTDDFLETIQKELGATL